MDQILLQPGVADHSYRYHSSLCDCDEPNHCLVFYQRCIINKRMFHSLVYNRPNSTVNYFVQYHYDGSVVNFGKVQYFFVLEQETFAMIEHHTVESRFSDFFSSSSYHQLLMKSIDNFFFVLAIQSFESHCVSVNSIVNHCVCFDHPNHIVVTPLSYSFEHD